MKITLSPFQIFFISLLDIPALYFIFFAVYKFRFHSGFISNAKGIPDFSTYSITFWGISTFLYFIFSLNGLYNRGFRFSPEKGWELTKSIVLGFLILTSFAFFYREYDYSRTAFVMALIFTIPAMNLFYFLRSKILKVLTPSSFDHSNIVIVGTCERAIQIYQSLKELQTELNLSMIGPSTVKLPANTNYLGEISEFSTLVKNESIHEVVIALSKNSYKQALKIIGECESRKIRFSVVPDLFEVVTKKMEIGQIHGVPVVRIGHGLMSKDLQTKLKRIFDILASGLSIIVFFPILVLLWLLVKIEDGGPLFYTQERVGLDGQVFSIIKFRSMRQDAEKQTGPTWALKGDTRWTRVGTFLRKTSIDELPQLWNVFKGDMSLVGPRPERPYFVNKFKDEIPGYMLRHRVRGGITGWAQANGLRGQSSIEDRTTYDLYYIENWSFWFDIKILFQTVFKLVFLQSGY
jgi:exopolysaccharide biosynthesis polyprenyl glycosylphosphotransferase